MNFTQYLSEAKTNIVLPLSKKVGSASFVRIDKLNKDGTVDITYTTDSQGKAEDSFERGVKIKTLASKLK